MRRNKPSLKDMQVAIIGLGLMGGSLAMALKGKVGGIVGVDIDKAVIRTAIERGIVNQGTQDVRQALSKVDLAILAVPVRQVISMIRRLPVLAPEGLAIVDLGSTKVEVVREMSRLPESYSAIGGHPMAGKEESGIDAAEPLLFHERTFAICPSERTDSFVEELVLEIVDTIGSQPLVIDASTHDEIVAATSHLPYMLSAVLMSLVANDASRHERWEWGLSASGLQDMTRLAGSDPTMMLDIFLTNRRLLVPVLRQFGKRLQEATDALEGGDDEGTRAWLESVWASHDRYKSATNSNRPSS